MLVNVMIVFKVLAAIRIMLTSFWIFERVFFLAASMLITISFLLICCQALFNQLAVCLSRTGHLRDILSPARLYTVLPLQSINHIQLFLSDG